MLNDLITQWDEGLVSTGEVLAKILCNESTIEAQLEAIATISLKLQEQEQKESDERFAEANWFNFTEHVRDYRIKDLSIGNEDEI